MEAYLNRQAARGWALERIGPFEQLARFRRTDRTDLRCCTDLLPYRRGKKGRAKVEEYLALCREGGWELADRRGALGVFVNPARHRSRPHPDRPGGGAGPLPPGAAQQPVLGADPPADRPDLLDLPAVDGVAVGRRGVDRRPSPEFICLLAPELGSDRAGGDAPPAGHPGAAAAGRPGLELGAGLAGTATSPPLPPGSCGAAPW